MKKAQMEIMGIAIVVIIISIVIIFVIRWGIFKEPIEHKKEFLQSEIATNLVNTLLSTTSNACKGLTFNELFQDCADGIPYGRTDCNDDGTLDSCDYADTEVGSIFDSTLRAWNYEYEFVVVSGGTNIIAIYHCESVERKTRTYPLPGNLEARLAICG